jgi:hypothetical protein
MDVMGALRLVCFSHIGRKSVVRPFATTLLPPFHAAHMNTVKYSTGTRIQH